MARLRETILVNSRLGTRLSAVIYFGYRYYSPYQRRWLNRDLLHEQGGINLYAYANGDPLGYVGPDGKWSVSVSRYLGGEVLHLVLTQILGVGG